MNGCRLNHDSMLMNEIFFLIMVNMRKKLEKLMYQKYFVKPYAHGELALFSLFLLRFGFVHNLSIVLLSEF